MTGRELQRFAYRQVRGRLAVASVFAVLGQLTAVALPYVLAKAIDSDAGWSVLVLALGAAGAVLLRAEQRISWMAGAEAVAEVRARVARGVVRRPPGLERGEMVSRVHRDGDLLWEWLSGRAEAPGMIIGVVATVAAVATVGLSLTVVACGALLGAAVVARLFPERFERRSRGVSDAHGGFAEHLDALVGGLVTVRGLGAESVLADGCRDRSRAVAATSRSLGRLGALWRTSTAAVPMLGGVVGLVVGALQVADGRLGVGGVVAFSAWMVILAQYSVGLVTLHQAGRTAAASSARLAALLTADDAGDGTGRALPPAVLRAGAAVLDGQPPLHLTAVPAGMVDARAADPGAAARLLTGETAPDGGVVVYGDRGLAEIPPGERAATLRRAPQHPILVTGTVADNVALGRTVDQDLIERACREAGILDDVRSLPDGFGTVLGDRGQGLSGGQRQRLGVARALLGAPPVVVLDDALSALDEETTTAVRAQLGSCASSVVVLSVR